MKNKKIILIGMIFTIALSGCNNSDKPLNNQVQFCLDNGGTHKYSYSKDGIKGECVLYNGETCDDQKFLLGTCEKPQQKSQNFNHINNPDKRLNSCEKNIEGWERESIPTGEIKDIDREEELITGNLYNRKGSINYSNGGKKRKMDIECSVNIDEGSISVTYDEPRNR